MLNRFITSLQNLQTMLCRYFARSVVRRIFLLAKRLQISSLTLPMLTGCGLLAPKPDSDLKAMARFYWPYAALATEVYRTRGVTDSHTAMALASPWLWEQVLSLAGKDRRDAALERLETLSFPDADQRYLDRLDQRCKEEHEQALKIAEGALTALPPSCDAAERLRNDEKTLKENKNDEPNEFVDAEPITTEDCAYNEGHAPLVPLVQVQLGEDGWKRVPELQKQTAARGWRLFVPHLAIDVWRRTRLTPNNTSEIEYAIVFRGTVGGGGWVSNLRGLTAMLPFVWDQYRQAEEVTQAIVDQLDRLHTLADSLLDRRPTRLRFTAVGHSLGGGLAQYIYLKVPRITRVVAFDPSPIDGSSLFSPEQRTAVTGSGRRDVDLDSRSSQAAIHLLYEKGEFISLFAPCHNGAVWGDEGGPHVRCDNVNFVHGNAFRQHNMAQLACHLFIEQHESVAKDGDL